MGLSQTILELTRAKSRHHAPAVFRRLPLLLSLAACSERSDAPAPTATATAAVGASQPAAIRTTTSSTRAAARPPKSCDGAPSWIGRPPCAAGGFIYAAGEADGSVTSRDTAATRARKRLALALGAHENDRHRLEGSEIDRLHECGGKTHALARVRAKPGELRACGPDELAAPILPRGCPPWSARMAWREGETLYGVAPMHAVLQPFQREQSAMNQIRRQVTEVLAVTLELTPDGVTASAEPVPLEEKARSRGSCDGTELLFVAYEKGTDSRPKAIQKPLRVQIPPAGLKKN
jgi:hypothetical protein